MSDITAARAKLKAMSKVKAELLMSHILFRRPPAFLLVLKLNSQI
jgi:hypothetical protein